MSTAIPLLPLCAFTACSRVKYAVAQAVQFRRSRVRFPMVSLEFFIDIILPAAQWVPGIFPGGKDGRWVRLTTLPLSCADCLEIWEPRLPWIFRAFAGLQWVCFFTCVSPNWPSFKAVEWWAEDFTRGPTDSFFETFSGVRNTRSNNENP